MEETRGSDTTSLPIEGQGPGLDRGIVGRFLQPAATDVDPETHTLVSSGPNAKSANARAKRFHPQAKDIQNRVGLPGLLP